MPLWRPVTAGEELFLKLHDEVGSHLSLITPAHIGTDFLVDHAQFSEFARLSATTELFLRCLRSACEVFRRTPDATPQAFSQYASYQVSIPGRLLESTVFAELLRNSARTAVTYRRTPQVERNATQGEPPLCYICGVAFGSRANSARTVEHLWPLSFGGETVDRNLVLACSGCNGVRGRTLTWASGPIQQTYYVRRASGGVGLPRALVVALALARKVSIGTHSRPELVGLTLKQIVHRLRPLARAVNLDADRPYVYFELHQLMRNAA